MTPEPAQAAHPRQRLVRERRQYNQVWAIAYYAARYGVDIDLLTRGAGFGYMGSTVTSRDSRRRRTQPLPAPSLSVRASIEATQRRFASASRNDPSMELRARVASCARVSPSARSTAR